MRLLVFILFISFLCSCASNDQRAELKDTVDQYYSNYQVRSEFDGFMDFYADSVQFEDIINGDRLSGKAAIREFFQWDNPEFKLLDSVAFIIEDQVVDQQKSITKGHFTPFEWSGTRYESMYFTSILEFNKDQKIVKHTDWINYPSNLVDYSKRKDSNKWIGK